jgi:hypothetical protein
MPQAKRQQEQPQQNSGSPGAMPTRQQDIRRIEARGGVTVLGVYDLNNVTVAQGKNVLHGERVVVDAVSGNAHFDSTNAATPGHVRAVILPNKDAKGGPHEHHVDRAGAGPAKPN